MEGLQAAAQDTASKKGEGDLAQVPAVCTQETQDTKPATPSTAISGEEEAPTPTAGDRKPAPPVPVRNFKAYHSGSVSSDMSSEIGSSSPREKEVPPAPPSTPASSTSMISLDGDAPNTPIAPLLRSDSYVTNARYLEQQQLQEAATPAPPAADTVATPKPGAKGAPSLPEDFSDWAVGDRYKLMRILGRGSYGEVAQAEDMIRSKQRRESVYVAIKRIQSPFDQQVDAVRLFREIHILRRMRSIRHDCVIQLLDIIPPPSDDLDDFHDLYLVFECKYSEYWLPTFIENR